MDLVWLLPLGTKLSVSDYFALQILSLKQRLIRLREVVLARYGEERANQVPSPDGITEEKLRGILITTDTCNAARKARRLFNERVGGDCPEIDCMNHLRCVHGGGFEKGVTKEWKGSLMGSEEEIDPILRVKCSFSAYCRAWDKFFSLNANYVKGAGGHFAAWFADTHPGDLLFHIENCVGSRQDICFLAAPGIYMNREPCYEYGDRLLRMAKKKDNILLRNLMTHMRSEETVAVTRLFSIFCVGWCMPFRALAGMTHELGDDYNWGVVSMGRVLDTMLEKMEELSAHPELILRRDVVLNWFKEFRDELDPFNDWWNFLLNDKVNQFFYVTLHSTKLSPQRQGPPRVC